MKICHEKIMADFFRRPILTNADEYEIIGLRREAA